MNIKPYQNLSLVDMEGEEWKDVVGYDGIYQVSNLGRIKSSQRYDTLGRIRKEKILKQFDNSHGSLTISLQYPGFQCKSIPVAGIVGEAFLGLRETGMCFCHINKVSSDNRVSNIVKTTYSKSILKDYELGRCKIRKGSPKSLYKSELGVFLWKELLEKYGRVKAYSITQSIRKGRNSLDVKWSREKVIN